MIHQLHNQDSTTIEATLNTNNMTVCVFELMTSDLLGSAKVEEAGDRVLLINPDELNISDTEELEEVLDNLADATGKMIAKVIAVSWK